MALTDAQKIVLSRTLSEGSRLFETGLMVPGGQILDQAAAQITADLATIDANSTDVPKGKDLRADLLRVQALASLPVSQMGGYAGAAQTWSTSVTTLLT